MTGNLRDELERKRSELVRQVGEHVIEDPNADIGEELSRIAAIDGVLKTTHTPRGKDLWGPLIIGLGCLAAIGAAWTLKVDSLGIRTDLLLTVSAETVRLTTDRDWEWSGQLRLKGREIRIERAAVSFSDPSRTFSSIADARWLYVDSPYLSLQRLNLKPATNLILEATDSDKIAAYAGGAGASGDILVNGNVRLEWQQQGTPIQRAELELDIPEIISFSVAERMGVPGRIVFERKSPFILHNLSVSSLGFGHQVSDAPGETEFVSTLESGKMRLTGVGQSYELLAGDRVKLSGLHGRVRQLSVEEPITVRFEGSVEGISLGPSGQERDVTPSVLSYVYYNQKIAFLFSAASFLWGVLWSLRRLIGA